MKFVLQIFNISPKILHQYYISIFILYNFTNKQGHMLSQLVHNTFFIFNKTKHTTQTFCLFLAQKKKKFDKKKNNFVMKANLILLLFFTRKSLPTDLLSSYFSSSTISFIKSSAFLIIRPFHCF